MTNNDLLTCLASPQVKSVHYRFVAVLIRLQGYFEELYSVFFKINLTNYGYYATTLPSYYISRISATDVEIEFS